MPCKGLDLTVTLSMQSTMCSADLNKLFFFTRAIASKCPPPFFGEMCWIFMCPGAHKLDYDTHEEVAATSYFSNV